MTQYVVVNENTLGYVIPGNGVGVLAGSVLRGGADWKNGPISLNVSDKVRPAIREDFDSYRVCVTGYIARGDIK
jgi:hypothetical protein